MQQANVKTADISGDRGSAALCMPVAPAELINLPQLLRLVVCTSLLVIIQLLWEEGLHKTDSQSVRRLCHRRFILYPKAGVLLQTYQ